MTRNIPIGWCCFMLAAVAFLVFNLVTAANIPSCEFEDGSTQETCIWDADVQGNGQGRSFTSYDFGTTIIYKGD